MSSGKILVLFVALTFSLAQAAMLPPRLSVHESHLRLTEGQTGVVLECILDIGDDPVSYRWIKNHQWVTGSLGYAYRVYRKVFLNLHKVQKQHEGTYTCEASNEAGEHSVTITVTVAESSAGKSVPAELPRTSELFSDFTASLNDFLAENECSCDVLFLVHASPDAPVETVSAQANLMFTIADAIVSDTMRVGVATYSDYLQSKLTFGEGTNRCALRDSFADLDHQKWSTRLLPTLRDVFKKFKKSTAACKMLVLPILGSAGAEGADLVGAQQLKKSGIKVFILEVTPHRMQNVSDMASKRGDGKPFHWHLPLHIWPTIALNLKEMTEELNGCNAVANIEKPGRCVALGSACGSAKECQGMGVGCVLGTCQPLQCNVNSSAPGCCSSPGKFWCGDVMRNCSSASSLCDGIVNCMNGADEEKCWSKSCPDDRVARCQSSSLCLKLSDLCDGEPHCPGGEDEDLMFCKSFPCPKDSFRCRNGKCIRKSDVCNGAFKDCEDGEDEDLDYCSRVHQCPSSHSFRCDYGVCLSERVLCDNVYNCLDASDEISCARRGTCPKDRPFQCHSGSCSANDKVCNGVRDGCDDGSDELDCVDFNCPLDRNYKCSNGRCLESLLVCDGKPDCTDGSDEVRCSSSKSDVASTMSPSKCSEDHFKCGDGICISANKLCDGHRDCGDDETDCGSYACPRDGSRPHRCGDGVCLAVTSVCDGVANCIDGSDEIHCITRPNPDEEDDNYDQEEDDAIYDAVDEPDTEPEDDDDHGDGQGGVHGNHIDRNTRPKDPAPANQGSPAAASKGGTGGATRVSVAMVPTVMTAMTLTLAILQHR